jgi:hypothetical protein
MTVNQSTFAEFLLPIDAGSVPQLPGVYRFAVRLPSDYELGLTDEEVDVERAIELLKTKLDRLSGVLHTRKLAGSIVEDKQSHIRHSFNIVAQARVEQTPAALMDRVSKHIEGLDELRQTVQLIRSLVGELPPIYVGITVERTLQTRLREHMDGRTRVLEALERCDLSWGRHKVPVFAGTSP